MLLSLTIASVVVSSRYTQLFQRRGREAIHNPKKTFLCPRRFVFTAAIRCSTYFAPKANFEEFRTQIKRYTLFWQITLHLCKDKLCELVFLSIGVSQADELTGLTHTNGSLCYGLTLQSSDVSTRSLLSIRLGTRVPGLYTQPLISMELTKSLELPWKWTRFGEPKYNKYI